jgi:hypothetical protein
MSLLVANLLSPKGFGHAHTHLTAQFYHWLLINAHWAFKYEFVYLWFYPRNRPLSLDIAHCCIIYLLERRSLEFSSIICVIYFFRNVFLLVDILVTTISFTLLKFSFSWVQVPPSINCRLLAHQRDGVRFLYNLYRNNHGGVLGDDM